MPGKTTCAKIKDPKKRARCEAYEGEYAAAKAKTPRRKPKGITKRRKPKLDRGIAAAASKIAKTGLY